MYKHTHTEFWYWEVIELTRKLILTGLIGMIHPSRFGPQELFLVPKKYLLS